MRPVREKLRDSEDNPNVIEGIRGAIGIEHWHDGSDIRINVYGSDWQEDNLYMVVETPDQSNQAKIISAIRNGGLVTIDDNKTIHVVRSGRSGQTAIGAVVRGYSKSALFSEEQCEKIIDLLNTPKKDV